MQKQITMIKEYFESYVLDLSRMTTNLSRILGRNVTGEIGWYEFRLFLEIVKDESIRQVNFMILPLGPESRPAEIWIFVFSMSFSLKKSHYPVFIRSEHRGKNLAFSLTKRKVKEHAKFLPRCS